MPTRPVSWELDTPPKSLLRPPAKIAPVTEVPSLEVLRASLIGPRFELFKVSTFAVFLLAFVGIALHGSYVANHDSQFVATTRAAIHVLSKTVADQTASLWGRASPPVLAARQKVGVVTAQVAASLAPVRTPAAGPLHPRLEVKRAGTVRYRIALADVASRFKGFIAPDAMVAGLAGLLLYGVFVFVLLRGRGGLRALGDSHAL